MKKDSKKSADFSNSLQNLLITPDFLDSHHLVKYYLDAICYVTKSIFYFFPARSAQNVFCVLLPSARPIPCPMENGGG
jgi:hypothetical protein